jgi:hypothetical protein
MGSVEHYPDHTFCWIDLGTNDPAGAKAFYGGLFGWEFEELASGDKGTYATCRLRGKAVAGLYDRAERPGWGSYLKVGDVDRATERARELGAEVLVAPFDTPGGGRVATVRDPAGAAVSLSQPGEGFGAQLVNEDGAWTWNELVSRDLAAGARFYTELFGWAAGELQGTIRRTTFTLGERLIGGGHEPVPQEDPTPGWRITFWVGDADETAARAQELGGSVPLPPMDIPVGRMTIVADPQGPVFTAAAVPGGAVRGVDAS